MAPSIAVQTPSGRLSGYVVNAGEVQVPANLTLTSKRLGTAYFAPVSGYGMCCMEHARHRKMQFCGARILQFNPDIRAIFAPID
jgi:hypothetical protein